MSSENPKLEQIRRTVNNTTIGQNAAARVPSHATNVSSVSGYEPERNIGQNLASSQSEKSMPQSPKSIATQAHRSHSVDALRLRRSSPWPEQNGARLKERTSDVIENVHTGSENQVPEDDSTRQGLNNRSKRATSMTYTKTNDYSFPSLRRRNSTPEFRKRKKLTRKNLVDRLTEDEIGYITRVNTKKNSNRDLKSRLKLVHTRAKLAIESISSPRAMDALPLVSPGKEGTSGLPFKTGSELPPHNMQAVQNEDQFLTIENLDSLEFDIEPATTTIDSNELSLKSSCSTPSVRISTLRTVVSISGTTRRARVSVVVEDVDREHPSLEAARALVPRSLQQKKGDSSKPLTNAQRKRALVARSHSMPGIF